MKLITAAIITAISLPVMAGGLSEEGPQRGNFKQNINSFNTIDRSNDATASIGNVTANGGTTGPVTMTGGTTSYTSTYKQRYQSGGLGGSFGSDCMVSRQVSFLFFSTQWAVRDKECDKQAAYALLRDTELRAGPEGGKFEHLADRMVLELDVVQDIINPGRVQQNFVHSDTYMGQ